MRCFMRWGRGVEHRLAPRHRVRSMDRLPRPAAGADPRRRAQPGRPRGAPQRQRDRRRQPRPLPPPRGCPRDGPAGRNQLQLLLGRSLGPALPRRPRPGHPAPRASRRAVQLITPRPASRPQTPACQQQTSPSCRPEAGRWIRRGSRPPRRIPAAPQRAWRRLWLAVPRRRLVVSHQECPFHLPPRVEFGPPATMRFCDAFAGCRVVSIRGRQTLTGARRSRVDTETLANQSNGRRTDSFELDDASDAPLPNAYGTDTLVFMVGDPRWAHAYWDISVARINDAVASLGGGRAFLRLIGVPTGYLLAEHEVWAERGSYGVALPEADHSYAAELAIVHDYRRVVLARSNVVQAPPSMPRHAWRRLDDVGACE